MAGAALVDLMSKVAHGSSDTIFQFSSKAHPEVQHQHIASITDTTAHFHI